MDNLITCEFCGTVYDPSEGRCPICQGKPESAENYMGDHYDYDERPIEEEPAQRRKGGKIIALLALILLFIGFTGYILYSFELLPFLKPTEPAPVQSTEPVPCTALSVDVSELTLTEEGQSARIQAVAEPADTTDRIIFSADNSAVISITQDGTVTAIAPGECNVNVICGEYIYRCKVICDFGEQKPEENASEAEPETESKPVSTEPLAISETDISFFEKGENTKLTLTGGDGSEPEWRSEDSSVAKVSSTGVVQAVGEGDVTITATVGDETVECLVRCQFE